MQGIVPAGTRNPNGHTETTVRNALYGRSGVRRLSFRYELLDATNTVVRELDNVVSGSVANDALADIKRTASFMLRDTGGINYLSDRIKPYVRLHVPPFGVLDWVEWPQGVFLLSTPSRSADSAGLVTRDVRGYDQLQILADDLVDSRYTIAAGGSYTSAITSLLAGVGVSYSVASSSLTAVTAREWDPGTSKLKIINEMLGVINYKSLVFDEEGVAQAHPYQSPADRSPEYTYADDETSVIIPGVEQTMDLFSVPNKWVLVVSDPDRDPLVGTYTNNDPGSPTSTVRRGRTITDFRQEQDAPDQTTLDALAARLAFEASQVYEQMGFSTAIMPIHSDGDVYTITYSGLAVSSKYSETSWSFNLQAGAEMAHKARRVVSV